MTFGMKLSLAILMATFIPLCGCSVLSSSETSVVPYSPLLLQHLQQGRKLVAEGRYELAKEQYLMALTSSNNPSTTQTIAEELHAVDLMIKTQR